MPRKKWDTFKRGPLIPKLPKSGFSEHMNRSTGWHLSQWKRRAYRKSAWNNDSATPLTELFLYFVVFLFAGSIFVSGLIDTIKDLIK